MLERMKPAWHIVDKISLIMGFVLCISGFLITNSALLFGYPKQILLPIPSNWYLGLVVFVLGIISYFLTLRGVEKFNSMPTAKTYLLCLIIMIIILNLRLYPPFYGLV